MGAGFREELAKSRFLPNGRPSGGVRQSQRCRGFLRVAEHDGGEGGADVSPARGGPWEYACRAGSNALFVISDDLEDLAKIANVADARLKQKFSNFDCIKGDDGFVYTAPVGSFERTRGVCMT